VAADLRLYKSTIWPLMNRSSPGIGGRGQNVWSLEIAHTPVSDRNNMAYAGSTAVLGRGLGLVVATGRHTEVGKIAHTVAEAVGAKPPLVLRMERFSHQISLVVLGFAALLGVIALGRGMAAVEVLFLVIAMAVSAIPEGLPVAMTVALSLSTGRMARRHVIVRRLTAVESLGSCTVIASDKTGTLTMNQQTARLIIHPDGTRLAVSGQGYNGEGESPWRAVAIAPRHACPPGGIGPRRSFVQ
jgi:magnesium-transporting ATPase (P-type)